MSSRTLIKRAREKGFLKLFQQKIEKEAWKKRPFSMFSIFYAITGGIFALYLGTFIDKYPTIAIKGIFASVFIVFGMGVKGMLEIKPNVQYPPAESIMVGSIGFMSIAFLQMIIISIFGYSGFRPPAQIVILFLITMAIAEEFMFTMIFDVLERIVAPNTYYQYFMVNLVVAFTFMVYHKGVYGSMPIILLCIFIGRIIMNWEYERFGIDASLTTHILINAIAGLTMSFR